MKKKFCIAALLCAALWLLPAVPAAAAEESTETDVRYARVEEAGVYLYRTASENTGLFVLPRTYFIRLTGESGDYYAVEYLSGMQGRSAVRGFCRKDEIVPVDYIPETPYLYYSVDVTFRTDGDAGLPAGFITEYTVSAPYYGTFSFGSSTYYYVELNGAFGYVPAVACSALDYPLNTEHTQPPAETTEESLPEPQGLSAASIALIAVLCAAALGALFFLFRPAPKKAPPPEEEAEEFFR